MTTQNSSAANLKLKSEESNSHTERLTKPNFSIMMSVHSDTGFSTYNVSKNPSLKSTDSKAQRELFKLLFTLSSFKSSQVLVKYLKPAGSDTGKMDRIFKSGNSKTHC